MLGGDCFRVTSAGTRPSHVHPLTLRALQDAGYATDGLRSKGLDEVPRRPFDYVITVCDEANACVIPPEGPECLRWSVNDPASVEGSESERAAAFEQTVTDLERRVNGFIAVAVRAKTRAYSHRQQLRPGQSAIAADAPVHARPRQLV
jgi:arsenate reductase